MNYFSQRLSKNPDTVPEEKKWNQLQFLFQKQGS